MSMCWIAHRGRFCRRSRSRRQRQPRRRSRVRRSARGQQSREPRQHYDARRLSGLAGGGERGVRPLARRGSALHPSQSAMHGHGGAQHELYPRNCLRRRQCQGEVAGRRHARRRDRLEHRGRQSRLDRSGEVPGRQRGADDGRAGFYGTLDGQFKALDARSGRLLWQFQASSGIIGQPIAYRGADGTRISRCWPASGARSAPSRGAARTSGTPRRITGWPMRSPIFPLPRIRAAGSTCSAYRETFAVGLVCIVCLAGCEREKRDLRLDPPRPRRWTRSRSCRTASAGRRPTSRWR